MKVRDIVKLIEEDGWYFVRTRGSHRHFKHPRKPGLVTSPVIQALTFPKARSTVF